MGNGSLFDTRKPAFGKNNGTYVRWIADKTMKWTQIPLFGQKRTVSTVKRTEDPLFAYF
ncbi:hypothetical protein GCM10022244_61620 [Streptomyces gulbargensis]|uniref:Uncharacterized protein n=1 Tax=Streptomyces gulbargensis TaxID=364901 RepID=A0ABP7NGY3_9ACTN